MIEIDILSVDYVTNDDITVNMRNLAGVSDTNEDVVMRVSMITAEVSHGNINSHSNDSPGIEDCVYAEHEKQDDLSAHILSKAIAVCCVLLFTCLISALPFLAAAP